MRARTSPTRLPQHAALSDGAGDVHVGVFDCLRSQHISTREPVRDPARSALPSAGQLGPVLAVLEGLLVANSAAVGAAYTYPQGID